MGEHGLEWVGDGGYWAAKAACFSMETMPTPKGVLWTVYGVRGFSDRLIGKGFEPRVEEAKAAAVACAQKWVREHAAELRAMLAFAGEDGDNAAFNRDEVAP